MTKCIRRLNWENKVPECKLSNEYQIWDEEKQKHKIIKLDWYKIIKQNEEKFKEILGEMKI